MNYSEIQAQVASWMNRDDLSARIPDFIALTEERMNRALRVRQMERVLPATGITANLITPAADVVDVKALWAPNYQSTPLCAQSLESVVASGSEGIPTMYGWQGGDLIFNGGGDVQGVLYVRIPAIASSFTNWVGDTAPSMYLFGALAEACLFVGDDAGAQNWLSRFDQAVDEASGNDQRRSGPLVARAR